jgi:hypothetical protein
MPSVLIGASGPQPLWSGNYFSGRSPFTCNGVQLLWDANGSGYCYVGFSGNMTAFSGGPYLSGNLGYVDGFPLSRGAGLFIPRHRLMPGLLSGELHVFARVDAAASGQRLSWETF